MRGNGREERTGVDPLGLSVQPVQGDGTHSLTLKIEYTLEEGSIVDATILPVDPPNIPQDLEGQCHLAMVLSNLSHVFIERLTGSLLTNLANVGSEESS